MKVNIPSLCVGSLLALAGHSYAAQSNSEFQDWLLEQLIGAEDGSTITMPAGTYSLDAELSLSANRVTLKGAGMGQTILSFKNRTNGAEGLLVTGSGVVLEGFSIEDSKGDGIKVMRADGITFRRVSVGWTGGPATTNGAYGLYPVQSQKVLIEDSVVFGASDAGIYVGQSRDIIVRNNHVYDNVAGIEIENSVHADVYGNQTHDNTAGILVFNMPSLQIYGDSTRVYQNRVTSNNQENFAAPTNIVASVPQGTGVMVMANRSVEVFNNVIEGNNTTNILVVSYFATGREPNDPNYNPYAEKVYIYGNSLANGGQNPNGGSAEASKEMIGALRTIVGVPFPDVLYDGGKRPDVTAADAICITAQPGLTFLNLDLLGDFEKMSPDLGPYQCKLEHLKAVVL